MCVLKVAGFNAHCIGLRASRILHLRRNYSLGAMCEIGWRMTPLAAAGKWFTTNLLSKMWCSTCVTHIPHVPASARDIAPLWYIVTFLPLRKLAWLADRETTPYSGNEGTRFDKTLYLSWKSHDLSRTQRRTGLMLAPKEEHAARTCLPVSQLSAPSSQLPSCRMRWHQRPRTNRRK